MSENTIGADPKVWRGGDAVLPAGGARPKKAVAGAAQPDRNLAINYLRAFVTILVLAHHAVIAYMPGLPKSPAVFGHAPLYWGAFPIEDKHTWTGFGLFTGFNDIFFMALMFFISGLFVWDSLKRKGAGGFLRDRLVRLGLPFAVAAGLIAPIAYFPSYLVTAADPSVGAYLKAWLGLGAWVSGPAWFLWVLLAFGAIAAGVYKFAPAVGEALGRLTGSADRRPLALFGKLVAASAVAYVSLSLVFGTEQWLSFGPFSVQACRILHYAVYFAAGIGVGAWGLERGLLSKTGAMQRRWRLWLGLTVPSFLVVVSVTISAYVFKGVPAPVWYVAGGAAFAVCCAAASFLFTALFVRFTNKRSMVWDSLAANAYGMYLVHYLFVTWLQYALLRSAMPGFNKGVLVFAGVLALSWGTTALVRRIPAVRRVL